MTAQSPLESFADQRLEALGLTRETLASRMGIASQRTLDAKLSNSTPLTLSQARAMAEALDTTVEHLCTLLEPTRPDSTDRPQSTEENPS